jgi:ATP-binding cassette subfamily B protein
VRDMVARAGLVRSAAWQAHPQLTRRILLLLPTTRGIAIVSAVLLKLIVNAVLADDQRQAAVWGVLLAALQGVSLTARRVQHRATMASSEDLRQHFDRELVALTAGMPGIRHYEERAFLDDLETIRSQPQVLGNAFITLAALVSAVVEGLIVIAILMTIHPLLGLLPVIAVPLVYARSRAHTSMTRVWTEVAPLSRQVRHLFSLMTSADAAKEIRVSQLSGELIRRHDDTSRTYESLLSRATLRNELVASTGWLTSGLLYAGSVLLVVHEAVNGRATVGDVLLTFSLAALVTATATAAMESLSRYLQADDLLERLVRLREHAAVDHATGVPVAPLPVPSLLTDGIRLEGVRFSYPGSSRTALDDLSLHLPAGKVVAVVGDNGAGKTTLVALLSRLYEPTSGSITIDGTPLRNVDVHEWRRRLSGAFQDFARFELVAQETVGIGDLSRVDDASAVRVALDRAGAASVLESLPAGLDSRLGSSFDDGVQLSGGQWQKLALGRALVLDGPLLLVLDEPTANLDPIAEQQLHERYAATARAWAQDTGTITLLVSHRFSTVRAADVIVVLDQGRLIEHGSHEELMSRAGLYAELYELQARGYR